MRINRTHMIDGVLTDFTSLKLSDPTGAFGMRRVDTQAIIVVDGVDFVHDSTGHYHYDVAALAGIQYEYWVERVYGGETKWDQRLFTPTAATGAYVPTWTTQAEVETYYRKRQTDLWSGGSNNAPDQDQWDRALRSTDRKFDKFCRDAGYSLPFPVDSPDFPFLSELATQWCGVELYWVVGGLRDYNPLPGQVDNPAGRASGMMRTHRDHVENELIRAHLFGLEGAANSRSSPAAIPRNIRPFSRYVPWVVDELVYTYW